MVHFKFNFVLLLNFISIFKVSLLETVHFTNSPNKILRANNYTTYKVEVPNGGQPITIIEANTPLINKNLKFNEVEDAKYSIKQNQDSRNHVVDLKTSLSMTVTPHNDNNERYENLQTGEEESVTNDYGNLSPEHTHHQHHTMKTVYSPELLEKFLKDYANKVQSTESSTFQPPRHSLAVDSDDVKNKYESIEAELDEDDDVNRRVSSASEDQDPAGPDDIQERKHYRPGSSNSYQHPYDKNSGWVSLDAVPWSKSKVSKWQSSVKPFTNNYNYQNGPSGGGYQSGSGNGGGYSNRPNRPPPYNYEEDNDNEDYYAQKPTRPSFQNNQFYGGSSSSSSFNRPPQDSHYSHSSNSAHQSSSFNNHNNNNNNYDNDYNRPNRPYQPEIITDNRPSNFPSHHESSYNQNEYSHNRPNSYDRPERPERPERPNRPHNDYHYSGSQNYNHYQHKDGAHPLTYPGTGTDGEWVLVSTTKGYQFPKRHGQRAMLINAQNGVSGTETRKTDNKGIVTAASNNYETTVSIRPPYHTGSSYQPGPTKMTQQHVKLTVLPLFNKYGENRPHQSHHKDVYKPSNYNGIIETEPSTQTVEESVAAAANANEANSLAASAQKVPKKKRKHTKNYAVMRQSPVSDSTAVLAAVGAGLLPASLGLLAPMVLGK